jgi:hypothetical protein
VNVWGYARGPLQGIAQARANEKGPPECSGGPLRKSRNYLTALFLALSLLKVTHLGSCLVGGFGEIKQVVTPEVAAVLPLSRVILVANRGR